LDLGILGRHNTLCGFNEKWIVVSGVRIVKQKMEMVVQGSAEVMICLTPASSPAHWNRGDGQERGKRSLACFAAQRGRVL